MPTLSSPRRRTTARVGQGPYPDILSRVGATVIAMIGTLVVTGIIAMITLHTRVATLTDNVQTMQSQMQRTLDHSVDRDEYLRRDAQIQAALNSMATKEEVRAVRDQLDQQTASLRVIEGAVSSRVLMPHTPHK